MWTGNNSGPAGQLTDEDLHQRHVAAERRSVLAECDAIDAMLDLLERRFGPDDVTTDTRRRTHAVRVRWLAQSSETVH